MNPFSPQPLGPLSIIPNPGVFEFTLNLDKTFSPLFDVKDTPSGHRDALAYP